MGHCCRHLKYRVLLVLTAVVAVYVLIVAAIGSLTIMPSFVALDRSAAMTNLQRCVDGIERESQHVATVCADWGAWDDTYRFVVDANKEYARANLVPETIETCSKINLLYIINAAGHVVARIEQCSDLGGPLHVAELPGADWPADHPLLKHSVPDSEIHGLLMTRWGPFLMASYPIVTSREEGPIRGTLVAGRFVSGDLLAGLKRDLHLDFGLHSLGSDDLSAEERDVVAALRSSSEGVLRQVNGDRQRGYVLLRDLFDRPALLLEAELDRGVVAQGSRALRYALISNIGAAVLLLAGIYWLMRRLILKRVDDMARAVVRIESSGDRSIRVPAQGSDELTALANQVNRMLSQVEMSEQDLRESRRVAEEANRTKSRFLSNVSHEIRTPMNGVIGFCEAILHAADLDTARQHAQVVLRESSLLLTLVNDLLDLSRLEAGKLVIERVPIDIHRLLSELGQTVSVQSRRKGLEFTVTVGPDVPRWIWGDPLRLRQILLNLAANAVKFTEKGRVWITGGVVQEQGKEHLSFSVHDTGIGIAEDRLQEIFEAFMQADASTTRKYGGTGLGLAIVRQLTGLMGGRVSVQSELGRGSVFSFQLPCERTPGPDEANEAEVEEFLAVPIPPARVLVADDCPSNLEVARMILEGAGHQVDVVSNGREAVELCAGSTFDLIILDVQMPVMDGLEAVSQIRHGSSSNAERPVLALTADADAAIRDDCLEAGFSGVITKPVRRAALLAAVVRWCHRARDSANGQAAHPMPDASELRDGAPPPIDRVTAEREFGGAEVFQRVLTGFLASAARQVEDLRNAVTKGERDSLRRIAHALKGGAATLEAVPLATAAARLDASAATASVEELRQEVERIAAQLRRMIRYLERDASDARGVEHAKPDHR